MENRSSDESGPIYYEVSPKITLAIKILGGGTTLMVVLSFIFTLVQATNNHSFYMLTCNIILTSFVGLTNVYWYWKGHLPQDKYWYMALVGFVIIWQCIATDVYVFHLPAKNDTIPTSTNYLT